MNTLRNKHRNYVYWFKNKEKLRTKEREVYTSLKDKIFDILGNKCSKCGFLDKRALQLDHIKADAYLEYKPGKHQRKLGTRSYYKMVFISLSNNENRFQILCANCNWIKKHENQEHRKRIKDGNSVCRQDQKIFAFLSL